MQEKTNQLTKIEVGLSLGSNMGDRLSHLREAVKAIRAIPFASVTVLSAIYETEPVGVKPEYRDMPYLNAVLLLETHLPLQTLSHAIHAIETQLGRIRQDDRFAPRTIDIDILYAGNLVSTDIALTVPHPRWTKRRFVLQPLADIRPELRIPGSTRTVAAHLADLPQGSEAVRKIPEPLTQGNAHP